jgi:hypothetical protein
MLSPGKDALGHATYERHRPEERLLYQSVHAPRFQFCMAVVVSSGSLPRAAVCAVRSLHVNQFSAPWKTMLRG